MGKYDNLNEQQLIDAWNESKGGPNIAILKALSKKQTITAAEFIFSCIFRQATSKDARSVISQLMEMGNITAKFLVKLIHQRNAVQGARLDEWVEFLKNMGEPAIVASQEELELQLNNYRISFDKLDEELSSLPEHLRDYARQFALLGFGAVVSKDKEAELMLQTSFLQSWTPHLKPEYTNWTAAWQYKNFELNDLAITIENLSEIVDSNLSPREYTENGSLILVRV
jgi:hypothetical protein